MYTRLHKKNYVPFALLLPPFQFVNTDLQNSDQNQSKYSRVMTQHEKPPTFNYLKNQHTGKEFWMSMWPSFS